MERNPVFRLFVSLTFEDMEAERQALHGGDDINAGSDTPGLLPGNISHLVDNEGLLA